MSGVKTPRCVKRAPVGLSSVCGSRFELLSHLLGPWAVDGSFFSYKGIQGAVEELCKSERDRQRNRGLFSGTLRGVSRRRKAS